MGRGHSGFGDAANDPTRVKEKGVGPLPPGKYRFGPAYLHPRLGPYCIDLEPMKGTDTFGRSLFRVHGDNSTPDPHDASHGCLVIGPMARRALAFTDDKILNVVE